MQILESHFQDVRFCRLGGRLRVLPLQVSRDDADAAAPGAPMQTRCLRGCCRFSAQGSTRVSASVSAGCLGLPAPETALTDMSHHTQKCPRDYPPPECWAGLSGSHFGQSQHSRPLGSLSSAWSSLVLEKMKFVHKEAHRLEKCHSEGQKLQKKYPEQPWCSRKSFQNLDRRLNKK